MIASGRPPDPPCSAETRRTSASNAAPSDLRRRSCAWTVAHLTRGAAEPITINGDWVLGVVTTRGHCSGASADGSTLVLANTGAQDRFAVVRDRKVRSLRFTGTFAVDAVANDGRTRFLIESVEDGTATYAVRDVDLVTGVLAEDPVVNVDVTERGRIPASSTEGLTMRGKPIDRAEHTDDWNDTLCFGLVNRRGEDGDGIHHGDRNRTRTCMPSTAEPAAPSLCFAYTGTGVAAGVV